MVNNVKQNIINDTIVFESEEDIKTIVKTIVQENVNKVDSKDPFWEKVEETLLNAIFLYVFYEYSEADKNLLSAKKLLHSRTANNLESMFEKLEEDNPNHPAAKMYNLFSYSTGHKVRQAILAICKNNSFLQLN